ncbi:unnamed protein product [Paramecium primaurelia]|uniref:Uncharacterized protein n=1 Tax=Paramecium primaurelia TaxID=5886 RepID=A0A8S1P0W3_PARPR|nr:unnamed protein product [Paramecium primaurelia]
MQRKNWKLEEDNALLQNCQQLNFNWKRVSKNMNQMGFKRSGKSCKERFQNQLNPHINKDQWSQNEIDKLFELQIKHGNKWRIIAKELPNRTDGLIKNYFYSLVRKVLRRLSKAVNRNKNGSKMTKTLKPSVISQIFCANQNETKQSPINLEFAYLFRNMIFKYKNYNLSQKIDNEDISKIKLIFLTLQKLKGGACNYLHLKKISTKFKKSLFNQMYEEHPDFKEKKEKENIEKSPKKHKKKEKKSKKKKSSSSRESSRRNSIERQKMINDWNETGIQNVSQAQKLMYGNNMPAPVYTPKVSMRTSPELLQLQLQLAALKEQLAAIKMS